MKRNLQFSTLLSLLLIFVGCQDSNDDPIEDPISIIEPFSIEVSTDNDEAIMADIKYSSLSDDQKYPYSVGVVAKDDLGLTEDATSSEIEQAIYSNLSTFYTGKDLDMTAVDDMYIFSGSTEVNLSQIWELEPAVEYYVAAYAVNNVQQLLTNVEYESFKLKGSVTSDQSEAVEFDCDGGDATIEFETNLPWSATVEYVNDAESEWITLGAESGDAGSQSLTLQLSANDTREARSANVIISLDGEDTNITFEVTQTAAAFYLSDITRTTMPKNVDTWIILDNYFEYEQIRPVLDAIIDIYYTDREITIVMPNVVSLPAYSFYGSTIEGKLMPRLVSVELPEAIEIGESAFKALTGLKNVSLPKVESLDGFAFNYCTAIESISLPAAKNLSYTVFEECTNLKEVSLPVVETMGSESFRACPSLTKLELSTEKQITQFGTHNLDMFYLGANTQNIDLITHADNADSDRGFFIVPSYDGMVSYGPFKTINGEEPTTAYKEFTLLKDFSADKYPTDSDEWEIQDLMASNVNYEGLIAALQTIDGSRKISITFTDMETVDNNAFFDNELKDIPSLYSVTYAKASNVGFRIFSNAVDLEKAYFPALTSAQYLMFEGCGSLNHLEISTNSDAVLVKFGDVQKDMFKGYNGFSNIDLVIGEQNSNLYDTKLGMFYAPDGVSGSVDYGPFKTINGEAPEAIKDFEYLADYTATDYPTSDTWYVKDDTAQPTWEEYGGLRAALDALAGSGREITVIIESVEVFQNEAFLEEGKDMSALAGFRGDKMTTVGFSVFENCTGLKSLELPNTYWLGNRVFAECTSLTTLDLGSQSTYYYASLGSDPFLNVDCSNITLTVGDPFAKRVHEEVYLKFTYPTVIYGPFKEIIIAE